MARAKNMQVLTNELKEEFPGVTIWGKGDEAHALRVSDHNEDDTAGVRAAQSDPDSNPEHRAIDIKIDQFFTRSDAYKIISRILNDPRLRARLWYINFENYQWSRSNGWVVVDNSDDPHPGHVHVSGLASNDEDSSGWFSGGNVMLKDQNVTLPTETLLTGEVLPLPNVRTLPADQALAWALHHAYAARRSAEEALLLARSAHTKLTQILEKLDGLLPGGQLPDSVQLHVPAHVVTVTIHPEGADNENG